MWNKKMVIVTAEQMQAMDRRTIDGFGVPGRVLMENAGRGAFDVLVRRFGPIGEKRVAILAGRGNNGGDGFVIARYLAEAGASVTVFLLSKTSKTGGDARENLRLFEKQVRAYDIPRVTEIPDLDAFQDHKSRLAHHDIFVDAILGTGLKSDVRGFFKEVIETLNRMSKRMGKPVLAVDIPSGLDSDTGRPRGAAVQATATATFGFAKAGHVLYPGNIYTGDLEVIDIGIPGFIEKEVGPRLFMITKKQIAALFPERNFQAHKGCFGHLAVVAGSTGKTGAASLCANAAMRSGTGLVTLALGVSLNSSVEPQVTEAMTLPLPEKKKGVPAPECAEAILTFSTGKQALAIGPGIGAGKPVQKMVRKLVRKSAIPLILDADAINCISGDPGILKEKSAPAVLTPHPGEMAALCGCKTEEIQENRVDVTRRFSMDNDCVLVLKGARTLVGTPEGDIWICPTGNPGMASGGMGDVLTGMIAGFAAQGFSPADAARAGVFIHGMCGDSLAETTGAFGYLASDMVRVIPGVIHDRLR